jgi:hypothetical protein
MGRRIASRRRFRTTWSDEILVRENHLATNFNCVLGLAPNTPEPDQRPRCNHDRIRCRLSSMDYYTTEKEAVFYLKATGMTVSSLHCWISSLNPERGNPGRSTAVLCRLYVFCGLLCFSWRFVFLEGSETITHLKGSASRDGLLCTSTAECE